MTLMTRVGRFSGYELGLQAGRSRYKAGERKLRALERALLPDMQVDKAVRRRRADRTAALGFLDRDRPPNEHYGRIQGREEVVILRNDQEYDAKRAAFRRHVQPDGVVGAYPGLVEVGTANDAVEP